MIGILLYFRHALAKQIRIGIVVSFALSISACSLFSGKIITVDDLRNTKSIRYYSIDDDFKYIVKKLNSDGEAVVRAEYFESQVYLQIFATDKGIVLRHYDLDEYLFLHEKE